jgi:DNA-binding transcriptional ArsR family regulator
MPLEDPHPEDVDIAVETFRMLADHTRIRLLWALHDVEELSVNDLAERVGKSQTSVSQHLAKLRLGGLVRVRRHGTQMLYRAENQHVLGLVIDALHHADHLGPDVPRHHRDVGRLSS